MMVWIVAAFEIVGISLAIRAIMATRTSQGAIAWVVSLIAFPYVSVPAYVLFGRRRFRGYEVHRKRLTTATNPHTQGFLTRARERDLIAHPGRERELLVEKLAALPFLRGNHVELLIDGDDTFASIFDGISRAKMYLLVQFYIINDDALGRELQRRLIEAVQRGVRVYLLFDEIGSTALPSRFVRTLRDHGVHARPFNSRRGWTNQWQLNFRNHRKIVVMDGAEAWVGGTNVGDEYLGRNAKIGRWRDTHARVHGPAARCVQMAFFEDWAWSAGEMLELDWEPDQGPPGADSAVLCLPSGPTDALETCTLFHLNAINAATRRLWIATPYFVPDEQFVSALQLAALRGVDVRILVPGRSDNPLVQLSIWSFVPDLQKVGIAVFHYIPGFMHQKVMLIDDRYATVSTANFDNRSFRLNFEVTLGVQDERFAGEVEQMLERDFANARQIRAEELASRSFPFRFAVRAARLLAPVQ